MLELLLVAGLRSHACAAHVEFALRGKSVDMIDPDLKHFYE